jgi:hypothetical protein
MFGIYYYPKHYIDLKELPTCVAKIQYNLYTKSIYHRIHNSYMPEHYMTLLGIHSNNDGRYKMILIKS